MKNVALFALLALTLAGCGSGGGGGPRETASNHGYGFDFDVQGASGMRLRYKPVLTTADPLSDPIFFENIYSQVESCMNVHAPAPFIIIVPAASLGNSPTGMYVLGEYVNNPSLILLEDGDDFILDILPHEFVHYLLDMSTGNLDAAHVSIYFKPKAEGGCI